jgi:choline-glycine betaine transporter
MRNGTIASLLVVALVIGVAFATVFFPRTLTVTTTQTTTIPTVMTTTLTLASTNQSYPLVTATRVTVLVNLVVATCTTVSGTRSIVYTYLFPGESTTLTTVYPPNLPHQYLVTVVTNSTVSPSDKTIGETNDTC